MDFPVFEKFEIKRIIARKICFTVYEAVDRRNESLVQIKVLDPILNNNESCVANFLNGTRLIEYINHPNICQAYDFGNDSSGGYYQAMDLIELESLSALVLDKFSLSLEDLISVFTNIGSTLRHAHLHGLLHGMLNPNSIYIKADGKIKIDDFGFSWFIPNLLQQIDANSLQLTRYIAPDYYQDADKVDGRADMYSLGLILYEILACRNPIVGNTIASIQSQHLAGKLPPIDMDQLELPGELWNVLEKCTKVDSNLRYQNLREYLKALENLKEPQSRSVNVASEQPPPNLVIHPADTNKYFYDSITSSDDTASDIKIKSIFNRKFVLTGIGALLLAVLVLFVTNYIPLSSRNNKSLDDTGWTTRRSPSVSTNGSNSAAIKNVEQPENYLPPAIVAEPPVSQKLPVTKAEPKPVVRRKTRPVKPPVVEQQPNPEIRFGKLNIIVTSEDEPLVANVFVNNKHAGKTSSAGKLEINNLLLDKTFAIRVAQQGYNTITKRIAVHESNAPVEFSLNSKRDIFGTILIDAVPRADEIYIDDVHQKGRTPLRISLKHGQHEIKLVNSALKTTWKQKFDLKISQVLRIRHDFTQKETGKLGISLKNAAQYGFGFVHVDGKLWPAKHNTTPLEIKLPVGVHTIELKRDGFNSIPQNVIVKVEKGKTKYIAFTFTRVNKGD